mgnify:CR=1 FL=1|tara:strand:+ start:2531 stop:3028 length:498 start_codon:yes stop_codon:yes gene_type:complete
MWAIIKYDKKNFHNLIQDFKKRIGNDFIIYRPKMQIKKFKNNKLISKPVDILGDYIFCFHKSFEKKTLVQNLKFCRGLKYFLNGFEEFQKDITSFINKCKNLEDRNGFITHSLFEIDLKTNYKFLSGPFAEKIFKIVKFKENKINILIGNLKTTVNKKDFLYSPV